MKRILLATTATVLMTGTAFAGSLVVPAANPVPMVAAPAAYDWSGFYVGAYGGQGFGEMVYTPGPTWTIASDLTYGGFAGYNYQMGSFVVGAELAAGMFDGIPTGFPTESFDYIVDAKLRAGVAMDNVLVYASGGYSFGHYTLAPGNDWSISGYNVGAGIEIGVTDNLAIGAEYVGRDLSGDTNLPGQTQDNWINSVQARVSWRF